MAKRKRLYTIRYYNGGECLAYIEAFNEKHAVHTFHNEVGYYTILKIN